MGRGVALRALPSDPSVVSELLPVPSSRLTIAIVQHSAQPLAAPDRSAITSMRFIRDDQPVSETLVVSLAMIQGLGNRLIIEEEPRADKTGAIRCRRRLGGLLNYYYRQAA